MSHCKKDLETGCHCDHDGCVKSVPIFQELEPQERQVISRLVTRKEYAAKEVIVHKDEKLSGLLIVRGGTLKQVRYGQEGKEIITGILTVGDFYGIDSLFSTYYSHDTLITTQPVAICWIASKDIKEVILSNARIGLKMIEYFSKMSQRDKERIETIAIKDSYVRVVRFLMDRTYYAATDRIELSQEDIGYAINLTPETVNRNLSKLRKAGYIQMEGHKNIKILNRLGMEEILLQ